MELSVADLVFASIVVAVGSLVQGSIGFGVNVVAAPLLVLIDTAFVPGPALASATVLTLLIGNRERHAIDMAGFGWIFVGRLPTSIGTALIVAILPDAMLAVVLASVVLVAIGLSLLGWRVRRTPPTLVTAGALSGFMGTISSVGGPPIAMLYQDEHGPVVRSTLSVIFAVGAVMSLLMLGLVGRFGPQEAVLTLVLVPGTIAGFAASRWTVGWIDRGLMRPAVLGLSAVSAISAIVFYAR